MCTCFACTTGRQVVVVVVVLTLSRFTVSPLVLTELWWRGDGEDGAVCVGRRSGESRMFTREQARSSEGLQKSKLWVLWRHFCFHRPDLEDQPVCRLPSSPLLFFFFDATQQSWLKSRKWFFFFVPVDNLRAVSITNLGIHSVSHFNSLPLCLQGHLPVSCLEVQSVNGPLPDSEHYLNVQGKALKVRVCDGADSQKNKKFRQKFYSWVQRKRCVVVFKGPVCEI